MQNPKFETVQTFKTVDRLEMTDHQYLVWWSEHSSEHRCADLSTAGVDMTCERQGYLVRYQSGTDQEYYSWSPKEIMDTAIIPPPGSSSSRSDGVSNEKSDWMESVLAPIDPITTRSPLFQKAYDEFVRQAGMVSLPQALEAAIVVYTDGLTYSEE